MSSNKLPFNWECISTKQDIYEKTFRAKVPTGWLVRTVITNSNGDSQTMVFIKDTCHDWVIDVSVKDK